MAKYEGREWAAANQGIVAVIPPGGGIRYEEQRIGLKKKPMQVAASGIDGPQLIGGLTPDHLQKLTHLGEAIRAYSMKVERDPSAVKILARLYKKRVLSRQAFKRGLTWRSAAAIAELAVARFCDVDADALRLRDEGAAFVEELVALAREA